MPKLCCKICGVMHDHTTPCVTNDPRNKPRRLRQLSKLRGLPDDCPGCLGYGTIERKPVGRARAGKHHKFRMTCTKCGAEFIEERAA